MTTLLQASALILIILFTVMLGVLSGYAAVHSVLFVFGRRSRTEEAAAPAVLAGTEQQA
ncbi:MAG TPA: hypothetical protein VGQ71_10030 [Terriglobales bacterium]|nr:hypothetical protein [Terriglobales bacterium]